MTINHNTKISVGIVIALIGAALSWGIINQKVDDLAVGQDHIREDVALIKTVLIRGNSQAGMQSIQASK